VHVVILKHFTVTVSVHIPATYFCSCMVAWKQFVRSRDVDAAKRTTYKAKMQQKKLATSWMQRTEPN
jgi:hypothetical protein